jgi:thermostable 8-oxoguanine DNA glycosylase
MNYFIGGVTAQEAWAGHGAKARLIRLPPCDAEVMPGVLWGSPEYFNTPAYWAVRCQWEEANPNYVTGRPDILREATFCLLGGFGIKYEINAAAFRRLDQNGFFLADPTRHSEETLRNWLLEPLDVNGRRIRYRFPNQRARRLARMRKQLSETRLAGLSATALRISLMQVEGIGPKTASWIVRNCLGSDEVAIIDVHLVRACQRMQVFPEELSLPRDYPALERRFLRFSEALRVRPSVLDAVIWSEVRRTGNT